MDFENLSNKLNEQKIQPKNEDNTFTNKKSIEYPSTQDLAKIQVINNNIRLLDEKKADDETIKENLKDVARESSPKNIENKINELNAKISKVSSQIEKRNNKNFYLYDNQKIDVINIPNKNQQQEVLSVSGKGYLFYAMFTSLNGATFTTDGRYQIIIDDTPIFDVTLTGGSVFNSQSTKLYQLQMGLLIPDMFRNLFLDTNETSFNRIYKGFRRSFSGDIDFYTSIPYDVSSKTNKHNFSTATLTVEIGKDLRKFTDLPLFLNNPDRLNPTYLQYGPHIIKDEPIKFNKNLKIVASRTNLKGNINTLYHYSLGEKREIL